MMMAAVAHAASCTHEALLCRCGPPQSAGRLPTAAADALVPRTACSIVSGPQRASAPMTPALVQTLVLRLGLGALMAQASWVRRAALLRQQVSLMASTLLMAQLP